MRFVGLSWITTSSSRAWVGSVTNKHNPSTKSGLGSHISYTFCTVIQLDNDHQVNNNCFNEPFAVLPYRGLYLDMHGLIFETSITLLAGSTRFILRLPLPHMQLQQQKMQNNKGSEQPNMSIQIQDNVSIGCHSISSFAATAPTFEPSKVAWVV